MKTNTVQAFNTNYLIQVIEVGTDKIEVNNKGYLIHFYDWNEEVAKAMAKTDQIELSDFHWKIFNYLREYYDTHEVPPPSRVMINAIGEKLNLYGLTRVTLKQIFPHGGIKHACRLAGLPTYRNFAC